MNAVVSTKVMDWTKYTLDEWLSQYGAFISINRMRGGHENRPRLLEMVHKVLYARYDAMKPTMLISNMSLAQLKTDLGDRLWSRFQHDGLTVVECNWADARVNQL